MLAREKPDIVILVTPYCITADCAIAAMRQDCHVLLEKPPGKDSEDCKRIAQAVEHYKPLHMVAFNRRSFPIIQRLMDLLYAPGHPEKIQHVGYKMYRYARREADFHTTAIHGIDLVRYVSRSEYEHADLRYLDMHSADKRYANMFVDARFASGATAHMDFCPDTGVIVERLEVVCDEVAYFVYLPVWGCADSPGRIERYARNRLDYVLDGREIVADERMFVTNGFYAQLAHFLECVKQGRQSEHGIASAIASLKMAECLEQRKPHYERDQGIT